MLLLEEYFFPTLTRPSQCGLKLEAPKHRVDGGYTVVKFLSV
jgi:hypothetical protein